jgi:hypothetical protein
MPDLYALRSLGVYAYRRHQAETHLVSYEDIIAERSALIGYDLAKSLTDHDPIPTSSRWLGSDKWYIGHRITPYLYRARIFND